jgi:hypothetical protein
VAHAFDTGLTRAQRTLIRAGAVTLLAPLLRSAGGYLQAVVPWGGVVRSYQDVEGIDLLWEALGGRAPSVAIALGDRVASPAGMGGFNFTTKLELVAYHYSNHPRDLELGRLEIDAVGLAANTGDPGLDVMMEHVEELLIGQRCGASATIKQIVPTREEELRSEHGFSLWAQRYELTVTRTINPNRGISQLITEFRTNVRTSDDPVRTIAAAPTGATMVGNVATYTTTTAHGLALGDMVQVAGVGVAGYNGLWTITQVPTGTTFKAQLDVAGLAASGGGTVTRAPLAAVKNTIP